MILLRYHGTVLDVFYNRDFLSILILDNGHSTPSIFLNDSKPPEPPRFTRIRPELYLLEHSRPSYETSCRVSVVGGAFGYSWTVSRERRLPVFVAACSIGAPPYLSTPEGDVMRVFYLRERGPGPAATPGPAAAEGNVVIDWPRHLPDGLIPNHFLYRFARGNARFLTMVAPTEKIQSEDLKKALSHRHGGPNRYFRWENSKRGPQEFISSSNIRGFDGRHWHNLHGLPITREDFESLPSTHGRHSMNYPAFVALLFLLGMSIVFFTCAAAIAGVS